VFCGADSAEWLLLRVTWVVEVKCLVYFDVPPSWRSGLVAIDCCAFFCCGIVGFGMKGPGSGFSVRWEFNPATLLAILTCAVGIVTGFVRNDDAISRQGRLLEKVNETQQQALQIQVRQNEQIMFLEKRMTRIEDGRTPIRN
jgi:hypothetical protein